MNDLNKIFTELVEKNPELLNDIDALTKKALEMMDIQDDPENPLLKRVH